MTVSELVIEARSAATPAQQQAAFTELVRRFEEFAFTRAFRTTGNVADAQDAAQDAFLLAWRRLGQLREPAAFGAWLGRLVGTSCSRQRRSAQKGKGAMVSKPDTSTDNRQHTDIVTRAVARLDERERRVVVLFYYLGHTLVEIAKILGVSRSTVGKRLYNARLNIRRALPASIRNRALPLERASKFLHRVREGIFDEYIGTYGFAKRPDLVVTIAREGDLLVGYGGGQRHVLGAISDTSLVPIEYDGEGKFRRDSRGRITGFVYYEFGKRLGVAQRR